MAALMACELMACEVSKPADVPSTTSAPLQLESSYTSLSRPNLKDEPAPLDPRTQRDLDIAAHAAQVSDLKNSAAVRVALLEDVNLEPAARTVDITTFAGTVTLRGHVRLRSERQEIEIRVRSIPGVRDVDDRIEIAP
jgi:BON domain-containing protein